MSERLEIDIKHSLTVIDQSKGETGSGTPQKGGQQPDSPSTTSTSPPTAVQTGQAQAVSPESATPESKVEGSKVSTKESLDKPQAVETPKVPSSPELVKEEGEERKKEKRHSRRIDTKKLEESGEKPEPKALEGPEAVSSKPSEPKVPAAPEPPPVASSAAEAATTAGTAAVETGAETAVVAGAETAAVVGAETAAVVGTEVAATAAGAGGGAGVGAMSGAVAGAAGGPPGMIVGAIAGLVAGGEAAKLLGEATAVLIDTFKQLDASIMQMVKDASHYNPQVAYAESQAKVADMLAQMRRAEELGPDLAEYTDIRSDFMVDVQDLITEVAPLFIRFMKVVLIFTDKAIEGLTVLIGWIEKLYNVIVESLDWVTGGFVKEWINAFFERENRKDVEQASKDFWDFLDPMKLQNKFKALPDTKPRNPKKSTEGFS